MLPAKLAHAGSRMGTHWAARIAERSSTGVWAAAGIRKWNDAFPVATVCIGNHDERVIRKATEAGIPRIMLRNYADIWQTPRWRWVGD